MTRKETSKQATFVAGNPRGLLYDETNNDNGSRMIRLIVDSVHASNMSDLCACMRQDWMHAFLQILQDDFDSYETSSMHPFDRCSRRGRRSHRFHCQQSRTLHYYTTPPMLFGTIAVVVSIVAGDRNMHPMLFHCFIISSSNLS